jgi:hypothetical protein
MFMKNLTLILLIVCLFCRCKKEPKNDNPITYPPVTLNGVYSSALVGEVGEVYMYTKSGVTTNAVLIKRFLDQNYKTGVPFSFDKHPFKIDSNFVTIVANGNENVKISVIPDAIEQNKLSFPLSYKPYNLNGTVINQSATDFVVRSIKSDSIHFPASLDTTSYLQLFKYKGIFKFVFYSDETLIIRTSIQPFVVQSGKIYLPISMGIAKTHQEVNNGIRDNFQVFPGSYNILNPDIRKQLGENDTVICQQELIQLIKK